MTSPLIDNAPDDFTITRQFAMSPDGNHVLQVDVMYIYDDVDGDGDADDLVDHRGSVLLLDVQSDTFQVVAAAGEYLLNAQWGPDGDIIANQWDDPVADATSTLVRIDGDALIAGTLDYEPIGVAPGDLLALSNAGDQALFAGKGAGCAAGDDDAAELFVWDIDGGSVPHRLAIADDAGSCPKYEYGGVTAAAFSPDDSAIAFSAETFFYCGVSGCWFPRDVHVIPNHRAQPVRISPTGTDEYQVLYDDEYGEENMRDFGIGVWWTT